MDLNPDGTIPYAQMRMTASTFTTHEWTKGECLTWIVREARHLTQLPWWESKKPVMSSLKEWIAKYDEAK